MPFVFDCPAGSCEESFDVAGDALAHASAAHPAEPLPAKLPGRFERQGGPGPARLTTRCRSCAAEISIEPGSTELPRCEACGGPIPDPEEGLHHDRRS